MARKQKAPPVDPTRFRNGATKSLAKLEGSVGTLLERQAEDRETVQAVAAELRDETRRQAKLVRDDFLLHTEQDAKHFDEVRTEQIRVARILNLGIGGIAALQFVIVITIAILGLKYFN